MSKLVCGGAGYIGSHAVRELLDQGEDVIVVDNLSTGFEKAIDSRAKFYNVDLHDEVALDLVFKKNKIDGVIHFAAFSLVGESVEKPLKYFKNNVDGTRSLLEVMNENDVKNIVFSSTAAIYGEPKGVPIKESDKTFPTNPYGESKLAVEKMLKWSEKAYGIKYMVLRYFNVAGAHTSGEIGEAHNPETHLLPIILQVALGEREFISIYGDTYDTYDGSCIRDYIHVNDLVDAHILALKALEDGKPSNTYNLGLGTGFSVKEIIDTVEKVTKIDIKRVIAEKRTGDPGTLIADYSKIKNDLNWNPSRSIKTIVEDAWKWHNTNRYN